LNKSAESKIRRLGEWPVSNESQLRKILVEAGEALGRYGFVSSLGIYAPGNISARLDSRHVLITPSGLAKSRLKEKEICVIDLDGRTVKGRLKPTSETPTHIALYRSRSDVNAIVHTHPKYATIFAIVGKSIPVVTIEMAGLVGSDVPVARFVAPGTVGLGKEVVRTLGNRMAVLLQNHGLITVGSRMSEAVNTAMAVEENAMLAYFATAISKPKIIPKMHVDRIRRYIQNEYGQR
jgi:L-ribulose-5-phosphate 4-epimerase